MYTGKVHVGGPADVRELPALVVSKLAVGPYDNNAYLLRCRQTGAQVLIDAAAEPERLLHLIGPDGLDAVVTTHRHPDHWQALAEVAERTGAPTAAHAMDAPGIP
ncbi:MAG: MBL fold metallo-hydrolase, partial [Actinomycetales bacterium]